MVESSKSKRSREVAISSYAVRPAVMLVRLHDEEAGRKGLQLQLGYIFDEDWFLDLLEALSRRKIKIVNEANSFTEEVRKSIDEFTD